MNTSSQHTILVTGASGFLGQHTVPYLKRYFEVRTQSLRDKTTISSPLLDGVDIVIYLTGIAHQSKQIDSSLYYTVNKDMALSLAHKARDSGTKHFIYISSIKAIGEGGKGIHQEGANCNPLTDYGKSKLLAEQELLQLSDDKFVVSVIRPSVVYGRGAKGNIDKLVKLIDKLPVIPLGGIQNKRSMVYIGNFLALLKRIIEYRVEGVFIAADDIAVSTSDIVNKINSLNPVKKKIINLPGIITKFIRAFKPDLYSKLFGDFEVDNSLTNKTLNFEPPYSFHEGMEEMFGRSSEFKKLQSDVPV